MTRPAPKGWCPSAYQPMASGDGLIVRLKPRFGRFTALQLKQISHYAAQFGNGVIDVTSRANFQIRGTTETGYPELLERLKSDGLVHEAPHVEQLNCLISPTVLPNSLGWKAADILYSMADRLQSLPAKFGFVIDTGPERLLTNASGDIRIEQAQNGGLLLRCDGVETGILTSLESLADDITTLTTWFLDQKKPSKRRMKHLASDIPNAWQITDPIAPIDDLPSASGDGRIISPAYGQFQAPALSQLVSDLAENTEIVILPNRSLMLIEGTFINIDGFITKADDPRLSVVICPGKPACKAARIDTQALAEELVASRDLPAHKKIHISACEKGCASATASDICITGEDGAYDIIEKGCAWQTASVTSVSLAALYQWLEYQ